jgi:xanthine dehydrogenase accessory factor
MRAIEQDVLRHTAGWLDAGEQVWFCTIVRTIGSSPRPVGSLLALSERGEQVGSLSGGCVEEDLLQRLGTGEYASATPELIEYGVSSEENERLGLPCGGRLFVLAQGLRPERDLRWVNTVLDALDKRRCTRRYLDLNTGLTRIDARQAFETLACDEAQLAQSFGPQMRMLLVGAGQLSQSLAELGQAMDYEVLVTDPRQHMLDQWEGPGVQLLPGMPDDAVRAHADDEHSVIVTLTHDPRIDDMALMEALESRAWYVGALGSRRTTERRLERLRDLGIAAANLERLHAPVGLPIGSKTPIEIAVSIMAELTRLRRAREYRG